jgi:hypothetical protein
MASATLPLHLAPFLERDFSERLPLYLFLSSCYRRVGRQAGVDWCYERLRQRASCFAAAAANCRSVVVPSPLLRVSFRQIEIPWHVRQYCPESKPERLNDRGQGLLEWCTQCLRGSWRCQTGRQARVRRGPGAAPPLFHPTRIAIRGTRQNSLILDRGPSIRRPIPEGDSAVWLAA